MFYFCAERARLLPAGGRDRRVAARSAAASLLHSRDGRYRGWRRRGHRRARGCGQGGGGHSLLTLLSGEKARQVLGRGWDREGGIWTGRAAILPEEGRRGLERAPTRCGEDRREHGSPRKPALRPSAGSALTPPWAFPPPRHPGSCSAPSVCQAGSWWPTPQGDTSHKATTCLQCPTAGVLFLCTAGTGNSLPGLSALLSQKLVRFTPLCLFVEY